MKRSISTAKLNMLAQTRFSPLFIVLLVLALLIAPGTTRAQQNWYATLGSQSTDQGTQAIAFLPNELWIHAGDSITWTSASGG